MKRILFLTPLCFAALLSDAQTLDPQVLSSAGTSFVNGPNTLDWTLGEPVTFTFTNGPNLLTQGFHQNDLVVTEIDNLVSSEGITVFPNPTADFVQIQFTNQSENNGYELFSAEGKLILSQLANSNSTAQIDMSTYSNGTYLLKINNKTSNGKSYQIVKLK